mmetsp:Transcript_45931/g.143844  ORF Transcript_45931/g.143844 Transcript_45931/m.143844 type:complete len:375 (+) Transcript_45931:1037-2161(+)
MASSCLPAMAASASRARVASASLRSYRSLQSLSSSSLLSRRRALCSRICSPRCSLLLTAAASASSASRARRRSSDADCSRPAISALAAERAPSRRVVSRWSCSSAASWAALCRCCSSTCCSRAALSSAKACCSACRALPPAWSCALSCEHSRAIRACTSSLSVARELCFRVQASPSSLRASLSPLRPSLIAAVASFSSRAWRLCCCRGGRTRARICWAAASRRSPTSATSSWASLLRSCSSARSLTAALRRRLPRASVLRSRSASLTQAWLCLPVATSRAAAARRWLNCSQASRSASCCLASCSTRSPSLTRCCVRRVISSVCTRICSTSLLFASLTVPSVSTRPSLASACCSMSPFRCSHLRCVSCRDCLSTS